VCGNAQCGVSDECCNDAYIGSVCYDPTTSDCVSGIKLCGKGEGACGSICFDTSLYTCNADGQLLQGSSTPSSPQPLFCSAFNLNPCGPGENCCDQTCFDPTVQICLNYDNLCPLGNSVCGVYCYNVDTEECCDNRIFPKGGSVCSSSEAICCSCSCSQESFETVSYTLYREECTVQTVTQNFGPLVCPNLSIGGACGPNCTADCGQYPFIFNYCVSDEQYGCTGHYLCSGGPFSCNVTSTGQCSNPVINSGTNTTTVGPGSIEYQPIPSGYQGEVCCWCAVTDIATSTPVPTAADCNVEYVAANAFFNYSNMECRVWSTFTPDSHVACGLPE